MKSVSLMKTVSKHFERKEMKASRISMVSMGLVFALAGCATTSASDTATESGGSGSSESAEGVVTMWIDDNVVNPCFADVVGGSWTDQEIELQIELKPEWDSLTKTAVAAGAGPDIIMTPGVSYTAEFAKAGALVPLDEYSDLYGWGASFAPWSMAMGVSDGTLYSLQGELETMVLWYNKTVFEENGIAAPTSTAELNQVADQFSGLGIQPFASGNVDWQGVNEWLLSSVWSAQGGSDNVYAALNGSGSFTSPSIVEATAQLTEWMQTGYIGGGLDRYYTTPIDDYLVQLAQGEAAMNIEGSWRFENIDQFFTEAGSEWDWVSFPTADGEPLFSIGTGSSWALNANGANPDAAAAVLDHVFDAATQAALVVQCGMSPSPITLDMADLSSIDDRQSRLYAEVAAAAESGSYGYLTWSFWGPKSNTYLVQEIENVWAGTMSETEFLAGLDAIFLEELEAGDVPPLPLR
jgi:raffinose/stachyose/melibiose transport system substrate-binding protein